MTEVNIGAYEIEDIEGARLIGGVSLASLRELVAHYENLEGDLAVGEETVIEIRLVDEDHPAGGRTWWRPIRFIPPKTQHFKLIDGKLMLLDDPDDEVLEHLGLPE